MPELPEVEVMVRKIDEWIRDVESVSAINLLVPEEEKAHKRYLQKHELGHLCDAKDWKVSRRGKLIVFRHDRGIVTCHNAMTGFWDTKDQPWTFDYVEGKRKSSENDVRVEFLLKMRSGVTRTLRFHDARKFGSMKSYSYIKSINDIDTLKKMGPEILLFPFCDKEAMQCTILEMAERLLKSKKPVKAALMDQSIIAGVGNIYANEGCWWACIDPTMPAHMLSKDQSMKVILSTANVIGNSLANNLEYSKFLRAYGINRCSRCSAKMQNIDIENRSTYFCPGCQK